MTGKEAAAWLGVSLPQWYRVIAPQIAGHRVSGPSGQIRYSIEDLEAWLAQNRVEPKQSTA